MQLPIGIRLGLASMVVAAACATAQSGGAPPPTPPGSTTVAPAGLTTLAGVYSTAQAVRGEGVFKASCLECHVPTDYMDEAFASKFVGGTVYDMWEQIRSSMPQNNPGSLTKEQYTDLVAYLFQLNRLPTRQADLPAVVDSLKAIKVQANPPYFHQHTYGARIHHGSSYIR